MLALPNGVQNEDQEEQYQEWLATHPNGFVLSLNKGRRGKRTVHRPHCKSISYDPAEIGRPKRTGKMCFETRSELREWVESNADFEAADVNWDCPQC